MEIAGQVFYYCGIQYLICWLHSKSVEKSSIARLPLLAYERLQLSRQIAEIHGNSPAVLIVHLLLQPPQLQSELVEIVESLIAGFQCVRFNMPDMKSTANTKSKGTGDR